MLGLCYGVVWGIDVGVFVMGYLFIDFVLGI